SLFFFSSRRRHTISKRDWSSDVCSSDLRRYFYWLVVFAGCGVNALSDPQSLAKSINCRNDVGLISVAHQATTFLLRSRIRFTQCQWIELYPFVITHP